MALYAVVRTVLHALLLIYKTEYCEVVFINGYRYVLLPALLSYFINKNTKMDRFDVVQKSQVLY